MQFILLSILLLAGPFAAHGQKRETPYWATISADELNMRVGPSRDYKIIWVFKRKGLPLRVLRVSESWRLVEDSEGDQGWVASRFLSKNRGAMVQGEGLAAVRASPTDNSRLNWNAQPGVVVKMGECAKAWCEVDIGGRKGWMREERLWGSGAP